MSAAAGLTTAIIAGFLAALFGGSGYQVSGPTGAMTVVLIPIIHSYGVGAIPKPRAAESTTEKVNRIFTKAIKSLTRLCF